MASPVYNPNDERYWQADDLLAEERRTFEVCDGCRLCWNLCPAFPALFESANAVENDLQQLGQPEFDHINDLCFQCKLCWVVCPYTEPHEYNLDVPALLERSNFIKAKKKGVKLAKKLVGDQDRLAKLAGGLASPMTNLTNKLGASRKIVAMVLDVHPDAILPEYHMQTFAAWFQKNYGDALRPENPVKKVAFFASCTVNYNDPEIGKACVRVLEHNNIEVIVPEQRCCGMPLVDIGDYDGATKKMDFNLERLSALVDEGYDIVVPQPTCALVLREDYPTRSKEAQAAKKVAEHTFEFGHYLSDLAREKVLLRDFKHSLGKVGFHVACHTRRQSAGINSPRLLGIIPGTEISALESCSGHDGTWGVSKQYFPLALKVGKKLFDNLNESSADVLVSDCPLAARHIQIGTGRRPIHSAQALAVAYGLDDAPAGVAKALPETGETESV
ncbi:MAG: heterodisulfide reductase-related iron-sulfur binding cluster [Chloroflexi bacterium]|nr:heterodisulfide reductase-related iron-sulfur binding cluster [Chloroflexota bacterium]